MTAIEFVTLEVSDAMAAEGFYREAFGLGDRIRLRTSQSATSGFRGFTLSLVVTQPSSVDHLLGTALEAGAVSLKPAARSLWGYGGAVEAPDGTVWTVASSTKKDTGPATPQIEDFVLQLGVADVAASRRFYVDRGVAVGKSYGRRYVEFDTGPVKLALYKRRALAKLAGVSAEGEGSHRLAIGSDAGSFADPDGFVWEST